MNTRRKKRLLLTLVMLAGLGLAIALVMYALRANIDLFYTPGEVLYGKGVKHERPGIGQRLRIGGKVTPGSVRRDPDTLRVSFSLSDASGSVDVSYDGILPDLFREGQGVVAQGILQERDRVLATTVLAKHDEKYTPPEITAAVGENRVAVDSEDSGGAQ